MSIDAMAQRCLHGMTFGPEIEGFCSEPWADVAQIVAESRIGVLQEGILYLQYQGLRFRIEGEAGERQFELHPPHFVLSEAERVLEITEGLLATIEAVSGANFYLTGRYPFEGVAQTIPGLPEKPRYRALHEAVGELLRRSASKNELYAMKAAPYGAALHFHLHHPNLTKNFFSPMGLQLWNAFVPCAHELTFEASKRFDLDFGDGYNRLKTFWWWAIEIGRAHHEGFATVQEMEEWWKSRVRLIWPDGKGGFDVDLSLPAGMEEVLQYSHFGTIWTQVRGSAGRPDGKPATFELRFHGAISLEGILWVLQEQITPRLLEVCTKHLDTLSSCDRCHLV